MYGSYPMGQNPYGLTMFQSPTELQPYVYQKEQMPEHGALAQTRAKTPTNTQKKPTNTPTNTSTKTTTSTPKKNPITPTIKTPTKTPTKTQSNTPTKTSAIIKSPKDSLKGMPVNALRRSSRSRSKSILSSH